MKMFKQDTNFLFIAEYCWEAPQVWFQVSVCSVNFVISNLFKPTLPVVRFPG